MSSSAELIFLRKDIRVDHPIELVRWYWKEVRRGPDYYGHPEVIIGDADAIEFGDLSWAVLLEGRPSSSAAQHLLHEAPISVEHISTEPLSELDFDQRADIGNIIFTMTKLNGFGTSLATKVLHVKRRRSVPVMDTGRSSAASCSRLGASELPQDVEQ